MHTTLFYELGLWIGIRRGMCTFTNKTIYIIMLKLYVFLQHDFEILKVLCSLCILVNGCLITQINHYICKVVLERPRSTLS